MTHRRAAHAQNSLKSTAAPQGKASVFDRMAAEAQGKAAFRPLTERTAVAVQPGPLLLGFGLWARPQKAG